MSNDKPAIEKATGNRPAVTKFRDKATGSYSKATGGNRVGGSVLPFERTAWFHAEAGTSPKGAALPATNKMLLYAGILIVLLGVWAYSQKALMDVNPNDDVRWRNSGWRNSPPREVPYKEEYAAD